MLKVKEKNNNFGLIHNTVVLLLRFQCLFLKAVKQEVRWSIASLVAKLLLEECCSGVSERSMALSCTGSPVTILITSLTCIYSSRTGVQSPGRRARYFADSMNTPSSDYQESKQPPFNYPGRSHSPLSTLFFSSHYASCLGLKSDCHSRFLQHTPFHSRHI